MLGGENSKYFADSSILYSGMNITGCEPHTSLAQLKKTSSFHLLISVKFTFLYFSKTYRARKCLTADNNAEDDEEEEEEEVKEDANGPVAAT